ncbi:molybdenum cofactor guanylyltransferase [Paenibacillus sp. WLX2291]|uniref:molybdenum cofactor guanylyltransferase n=1 Tax=Paenibacillus sp. WLX2291 TaxID=3296934 RepID=UPI00398455D8
MDQRNQRQNNSKVATAGIILAGGQSRRMGRDKALLDIGGQTVIERVVAAVQPCVDQMCLASALDRQYDVLNIPLAQDEFPGAGPLSGLYAGMNTLDAEWYVLSACDLPFASTNLLNLLLHEAYNSEVQYDGTPTVQAVVPTYQQRTHPLYAVYHHSVRASLATSLQQGQLKVMDWLGQHHVRKLSLEDILRTQPSDMQGDLTAWCLHNMNDPQAYEQARKLHIVPKPFDS